MAKQSTAPLVALAQKYIGTPYVYGGTTPKGFDCSGFVQWLYKQQGIDIPRVTYDQVNAGTPVDKGNLRAGDIVFFEPDAKGPGHEGLYIGDGKFIEAPHTARYPGDPGGVVRVSELAGRSDYVSARRIIPDGAPLIGNVAHATPPDAPVTPPTDTPTTAPTAAPVAASGLPLAPTVTPLPTITPPAAVNGPMPPGGGPIAPGGGLQAPGTNPWQQLQTLPNLSPDTQNLIAIAGDNPGS